MISGGAATVLGGNRMLKASQNYCCYDFVYYFCANQTAHDKKNYQ